MCLLVIKIISQKNLNDHKTWLLLGNISFSVWLQLNIKSLNHFSVVFLFPLSSPSLSSCCYTVSVATRSSTIRQTVSCLSPSPAWWDTAYRLLCLSDTTGTHTRRPTRPPPASRRITPTMGVCSRVCTWARGGVWSTNTAVWPGWLRSCMTQHLLLSPMMRQQVLWKPSTWCTKDSSAPFATDRQVQSFFTQTQTLAVWAGDMSLLSQSYEIQTSQNFILVMVDIMIMVILAESLQKKLWKTKLNILYIFE